MANRFYGLGVQAFAQKVINWNTDTISAALVSNAYTPNTTTDEFLSDISGGDIIAAGVALSGKSSIIGNLDAANTTWSSVTTGLTASYIVIYQDTGVAGTSRLIGLVDTAAGLPVLTDGGDITAAWQFGTVATL